MEPASFSIENYRFEKVVIELANKTSDDIKIGFAPSGVYRKEGSTYNLSFDFTARCEGAEEPFVNIRCVGVFKFSIPINSIEDIPQFFYQNSIAILFPYIRAYISIVTLQANIPPFVLPTMNLMSLAEPLKKNTTEL